ncbi:hypothetical protein GRF29_112g836925 [Pseudopithomyces chartarum]|uniref:Uncharacterized protein n=1 Tax=Pseudopithomyces chartarum TaxID=1892770 RepID=A0AAN6RDN5_9PLEO|nr:hypothetical protein GRF29_112g836925 [Pseudopithomyces chartarum]
MIARARPPTTTLPASLIFTPRELKQYRRFQAQTTLLKPKDQGFLPSAAEYADFQAWLAKRDSGYLSDTPLADIASYVERASGTKEEKGKATICGHALHPSYKDKAERCPVCIVEMHNTFMKVLTVALEDAGGLVAQRWEAADREAPALQAWYTNKLAFIRDIHWLEHIAQDEQEYDKQHQAPRCSEDTAVEPKTAIQAIRLYWDSIEAINTATTASRPSQQKPLRSVVFCSETSFEPGRDQHYFWRKSPRYEAGGKYASSSDCDDQDVEQDTTEVQSSGETCPATAVTKATAARVESEDEEDQCDDYARDQEDDEDDWEDEDESSEEEEDSEDEGDDYDDDDTDADYIVFEYEEVVVEGADFIMFED